MKVKKVKLTHKETKKEFWYDLTWGGCDRHGYLPVLEIGKERQWNPDNRFPVDPNDYDFEVMPDANENPIEARVKALRFNDSLDTGHNEWKHYQIIQRVMGGWLFLNLDGETYLPVDSGTFVPDPRQAAVARGKVSESIFSNGEEVIPMAEVSHIIRNEKSIDIVFKHSKSKGYGVWEPYVCIIGKEKVERFMQAWTTYRFEVEGGTSAFEEPDSKKERSGGSHG